MDLDFINDMKLMQFRTLILSVALNGIIEEDVEKIYNENPLYYYKLYKNSPFYKDKSESFYKSSSVEKIKHATGIVIHSEMIAQNDTVLKLIKKGYKRIYQIVNNSKDYVEGAMVYLPLVKKLQAKNKVDALSEIELFNSITSLMYLTTKLGKQLKNDDFMHGFYADYMLKLSHTDIDKSSFFDEQLKKHKDEIKTLRQKYLPIRDKQIYFEDIIETITFGEHRKYIEQTGNIGFPRDQVFKIGKLSKYIGAVNGIFDNTGIKDDYFNFVFTQRDLDIVCLRFIFAKEMNNLDVVHEPLYIYFSLFVYALGKEFFWVRNAYLEESVEKMFAQQQIEEEANEKKILELRNELEIKLQEAERRERDEAIKATQKEEYIKQLERDLREQKARNEKLVDYSNEVKALRQYVHDNETEEKEIAVPYEDKVRVLNDTQMIIYGGHTKWVNSLREIFPNARIITPDDKSMNLNYLANYRGIFVTNTSVASHSMTEKVLQSLNTQAKIIYINNRYGIQRTVDYLYGKVTD